jgi:hypothetical protein
VTVWGGKTCTTREVTAVLTLYGYVLGAGELGVEDCEFVRRTTSSCKECNTPCVPQVKKKNMAVVCGRASQCADESADYRLREVMVLGASSRW